MQLQGKKVFLKSVSNIPGIFHPFFGFHSTVTLSEPSCISGMYLTKQIYLSPIPNEVGVSLRTVIHWIVRINAIVRYLYFFSFFLISYL